MVCVAAVISLSYATPSNAFLGLSTCEKAWKQIDSEDAVGLKLWKSFRIRLKEHRAAQTSPEKWFYAGSALSLLYASNVSVYSIALKHGECFNADAIAYMRSQRKVLQSTKAQWDQVLPEVRSGHLPFSPIASSAYDKYLTLRQQMAGAKW